MNNNKKLILEKNIQRFDYYIEKADNKANFILAFSGILLGGILFQSENLINKNVGQGLKLLVFHLLIISLISLILAVIFAVFVIIPRTPKVPIKSIMFFQSIKNMDKVDYENAINNLNDDGALQEFINESMELAQICSKKMILIKRALISQITSMVLIFIIIVIKFSTAL